MIKLKSLIREAFPGQVTPDSIRYYWHFTLNAIAGRNPDSFYRQFQKDIDAVAVALRSRYGPTTGGTVYRGIILDPSEVHNGVVKHAPEITYVSFSEDKNIAMAFGDTKNPSAGPMLRKYPNKQGYIIVETYDPSLLLFHHSWLEPTKMIPVVRQLFGSDANFIEMQKEVILKPEPEYKVEPVTPGASGGLEMDRE